MAQETVKVGIIGAGGNTRSRHIPGLQAIEGVENRRGLQSESGILTTGSR